MKKENWFPYLYAIMGMIVIQFLTMLWLVGDIAIQVDNLRGAVDRLKQPVKNQVVTVDGRLFTTLNGKIYEMVRPNQRGCKNEI